MAELPRHLYKPGDRVLVFNANMRGEKIVEGIATIVRHIEALDHTYMVQFDDALDRGIYERLIGPNQAA